MFYDKSGKNNPNYKGGLPKCIDCGKELKKYRSKRCRPCSHTFNKGKNHSFFGRKHKEESKNKMSKSKKAMDVYYGETNPNFGKGLFGSDNGRYIDGRSTIAKFIRYCSESKRWRDNIFKRDSYTCTDCGFKGGYLEAHHIKSFKILLSEFLKEYDQFSPIEDKYTLLRLATKYDPFWDIDNGITLCVKCHDKKEAHCAK